MSLPTIETPKYTLTVPSTGKQLKYRPFVVREQKLMLQAIEMKDEGQLNNAVEDVIRQCTFDAFDIDSSPVYDVEYVMLNVRAKSSGELVNMFYRCNAEISEDKPVGMATKCGTKIPVQIPLNDVQVFRPEGHEYKIMLTDNIGVTMRDLPYGVYKTQSAKNLLEKGLDVISSCIVNVFDTDRVHTPGKDFTPDELEVFLGNLHEDNLKKLETFIDTMPRLEMVLPLKCPKCGNEDKITLTGLNDFLA
jgi:hypothetical protein